MEQEINADVEINFRQASENDLERVASFLAPFMESEFLLPRTDEELGKLIENGFVAEHGSKIIGFAAVEFYSKKLAEIQCLAVDGEFRRRGIGKDLVSRCVKRAAEFNVLELMAISTSDEMFKACGFDYSLPNQKRALFIQP